MMLLDGKAVANFHRERIESKIYDFQERHIQPELAIIIAGHDKPSLMYASSMQKTARNVGLSAEIYTLAESVSEDDIISMIQHFNENSRIFGILMMMPLPRHLNTARVINSISPAKDVDGLTDVNIARLFSGRPGFVPCTPRAVMAILDYYHISLTGRDVVIIGRSNVVGKPLAQLCLNRNATVTHCHTRTKDLAATARRADILISAAGCPGLITADMVKPGAVVVDVGINRVGNKTVGDVDFDAVAEVAGAVTPVPGGVGAVTTMMVLENVVSGNTTAD